MRVQDVIGYLTALYPNAPATMRGDLVLGAWIVAGDDPPPEPPTNPEPDPSPPPPDPPAPATPAQVVSYLDDLLSRTVDPYTAIVTSCIQIVSSSANPYGG